MTGQARRSVLTFEVDSLPGQNARADVARAVVQSGWNLIELRSLTQSLEEVFLELTGTRAESVPAILRQLEPLLSESVQ